MGARQAEHSTRIVARVLGLSKSGYYAWLGREPYRHAQAKAALVEAVERIHTASRGTHGSPRVAAGLRREGQRVSRKRVARLMGARGLRGVSRRHFEADALNQPWVATRCGAHHLHPHAARLALPGDRPRRLHRSTTGRRWWAGLDTEMRTELVVSALDMALARRRPNDVIHHSDQGCQYTSVELGLRCQQAGVLPSMGSVGDCDDNAMAESFFTTLEYELSRRILFDDPATARREIFAFIESFYNIRRLRCSINYLVQNQKVDYPQKNSDINRLSVSPSPPRSFPNRSTGWTHPATTTTSTSIHEIGATSVTATCDTAAENYTCT